MKTLANLLAIGFMALITYTVMRALPASLPFHTEAPVWTLVFTAAFGGLALHEWQPRVSGRHSPLEWIEGYLFFLGLSIVLFLIACWLRDVPLQEAIGFPRKLWEDHPSYFHQRAFWWSMIFGPGATLLAIGSLIRLALLWLLNVPAPTSEEIFADQQGPQHWLKRYVGERTVAFLFLVLWVLALVVAYDLHDHRTTGSLVFASLWVAGILAFSITLARTRLARLRFTLTAIVAIVLIAWAVTH